MGEFVKLLQIPVPNNAYNKKIGAVDLEDEYRRYYDTQKVTVCVWYPLFHWWWDTKVDNKQLMYWTTSAWQNSALRHKQYRLQLALYLIRYKENRYHSQKHRATSNLHQSDLFKKKRKANSADLPPTNKRDSCGHLPIIHTSRIDCWWCSIKKQRNERKVWDKWMLKTEFYCERCKVPLCLNKSWNSWRDFHKQVNYT